MVTPRISSLLTLAVLATTLPAQAPRDCVPSLWRTGTPAVGATLQFSLSAAPQCLLAQLLSLDPGPTSFLGRSFAIGSNALALPLAVVPANGAAVQGSLSIPNQPALAGIDLFQLAVGVGAGPIDPVVGPAGRLRIHASNPTSGSVVILTEQALDNGHSAVIAAAQRLRTTAEALTNDNQTVLFGNPWLGWSANHAGDVVTIPMGQPGNEGMFTLPAATPWPLAAFVAGTIPQPQLDNIPGVMPVRNQDLAAMVGQTFVAVVYDSGVGINYQPLLANLQGERCGRLAFTVLDVLLPGTLAESNSSTSLYDLLVRIEAPLAAAGARQTPILDEPADSIQITQASWAQGRLRVRATSALGALATMTASVDGFTFESPMRWNAQAAEYQLDLRSAVSLVGRRVTISSREGGSYTITVQ
jgi:hypothetical protein